MRRRVARSTAISLVLALLAAVSCLLLLAPAWSSSAGPWVTAALAVGSVAAGIVTLERRSGGSAWAVTAVAVAGVAGVVATAGALPQPDLQAHVSGYQDCPTLTATPPAEIEPEAFKSAFYAPALVGVETSPADALPFGDTITVAATAAEPATDLAAFTVGEPVDATKAAHSPPEHGVYLAVPVTVTAIDKGAFACFDWRAPPTSWFDGAGGTTPFAAVEIDGYPTIDAGGVTNGDGTFTYYEIFDVTADAVAKGGFEMGLLEPDATIKPVYWAEAPS